MGQNCSPDVVGLFPTLLLADAGLFVAVPFLTEQLVKCIR